MNIRVSELLMKKISLNRPQSPYSKGFEDCLDPKMKKIVMTLVKKGYLPSASCEGHSFLEPRYIVLCFGSMESRLRFKNSFPGFLTKESDTVSTEKFDNLVLRHQTRQEEIQGLNLLFLRNFEQFWFLRIYLGAYVDILENESWAMVKGKQLLTILLNVSMRQLHTKYFEKKCSELSQVCE